MIVEKSLVVSNKKKSSLEEELRALKFKPFPKTKKAKEAGEDETFLEEDDEGKAGDYDYLLGMAIWSLTREKVSIVDQGACAFRDADHDCCSFLLDRETDPREGSKGSRACHIAQADTHRYLEQRSRAFLD